MKRGDLIILILLVVILNFISVSAQVLVKNVEGYNLIEEKEEGSVYSAKYSINYNAESYIYDVVVTDVGKKEALNAWNDLNGETKTFGDVHYKIINEESNYYMVWVSKKYLVKIGPGKDGAQEELMEELSLAYGKKYPSETKLQKMVNWFKRLFGGGDYSKKDYAQDRILMLKYFKCMSLCPVIEENSVRIFEQSCMIYCNNEYFKNISKEYSTLVQEEPEKFLNDFNSCWTNLRNDLNFDYASCFNKIFEENKKIADLSEFKLGDYQKYDLIIEDLNCSEDSISVKAKLNKGTNGLKLKILGTDNESVAKIQDSFDAPLVGESKEYNLVYSDYGVEANSVFKVAVSLDVGGMLISSGEKICN